MRALIRTATTIFVLALVLGGALARFAERNKTFFGDEMWVLEFAAKGRYTPHAVPQPPLFFFSAVAASRLCGMSEPCMRMPAQLAAILLTLMPLLVWRTTRLLQPAGVIVWTAILAFSSPITFYAGRVKQYPLEALGCALVIWLFVRASDEDSRWTAYAIGTALILATMHAPVFAVVAAGVAALIVARTPQQRIRLFAMHVALAAVFAIAYFGYMRPGAEVARYFGNLEQYFSTDRPAFWDGSATFVLSQTKLWLWQFFNNTRGFAPVLALAIVAYLVKRRERAIAVIALLPIAVVLFASAARLYPYSEIRLMLFLLPGLSLLFALAVQWLLAQRRLIAAPVALVVLALLTMFTIHGVRDDTYNVSYMHVDDLHRAYAYLNAHRRPGTPVLVREFDARPLLHYVDISRRDVVLLKPGAREAATPAPEYWTFLRATDGLRVRPQGTVAEEIRDGRMRIVRYRR